MTGCIAPAFRDKVTLPMKERRVEHVPVSGPKAYDPFPFKVVVAGTKRVARLP